MIQNFWNTGTYLPVRFGGVTKKKKINLAQDWLKGLEASFFEERLWKLFPRYGKRLNLHGDYVEKKFNVGSNMLQ